ncbi:FAD-binding oxidoreductase [Emcibacteraceae bacterium Y4]|nr:FAD-dependent oxidoreductase [Pseudemcibacter aquimaris]MCC3862421.1 FAD-binding oxidoreductase [Pseudemcibacter aquimaris]WDU59149.1 FAD-binding oxidoreductase [Pseudemcibacter aquimaris]
MVNKNTKDCVVIGAGVIGVVTAFQLLKSGKKVTLIDKGEPAMECSYGNCALFATDEIFPTPSLSIIPKIPGMLFNSESPLVIKPDYMLSFIPWGLRFLWACRPSKNKSGVEALKNLNKNALADWQDVMKSANADRFLRQNGNLHVFKTARGHEEGKELLESLNTHDIRARMVNAQELKEMVPDISDDQHGAVQFLDTGHSIEPHGLVRAVFDQFIADGGTFIKEQVHTLKKTETGVDISYGENTLHAEKLVIAAGYKSAELTAQLGYKVPLTAERGYHLMLPKHKNLEYALTHHERHFVITPLENGLRLAGTAEFAKNSENPTMDRARMLTKFATELLPDLSSEIESEWMGCRPTLPDYLPVIDQKENVFFAFGHSHLGLTQAASTANIIRDMVANKETETIKTNNRSFSIDRF